MKKKIAGRIYDTEKAAALWTASDEHPAPGSRAYKETLLRKHSGEYFLHGFYGSSLQLETIAPLTYEEARSWGELQMDAAAYQAEFEGSASDTGLVKMTISMPPAVADLIRREAQKAGISASELIRSKFTA